jgi:hypothetical protein
MREADRGRRTAGATRMTMEQAGEELCRRLDLKGARSPTG